LGAVLAGLGRTLREYLPKSTAFVRFDPACSGVEQPEARPVLRRAAVDVQPPDTVIVDVARTEEEILGGMKEKWRYNIRLAAKKGVSVRPFRAGTDSASSIDAGIDVFYALLAETARRDGIAIHSREYYAGLFSLAAEYPESAVLRPDIRLYVAEHEGDPLAAVVTLFRGGEAVYLYGASSNRKRNLMAPCLLQWTAMRDAKASGCLRYDLFGIPPDDNPAHPMAGLYRFKTGFGGRILHRSGSWDFDLRPAAAPLFRFAEGMRKTLRSFRKNRPRSRD
jgi:lipid II:glycine glycyltransferase (peptidoglycan interpeptide bridge formation enzyme)